MLKKYDGSIAIVCVDRALNAPDGLGAGRPVAGGTGLGPAIVTVTPPAALGR